MSNSFTCVANLGADPEPFTIGERELMKVRCATEVPGKKQITRWFNATLSGRDTEVAARLKKGDKILITGQLGKSTYVPKKPRYKGEVIEVDEMPYARIMQVIKSPTFFAAAEEQAEVDPPEVAAADNNAQADFINDL